jgi:hypothetical protein
MLTGDVFYKIIRIGSNALTVTSESGTNCNFSYGRFLEFFYEPGPVPQDNYLIFN